MSDDFSVKEDVVLDFYIEKQQEQINSLTQNNLVLNTKNNVLQEQIKLYKQADDIIRDLRRQNNEKERKLIDLTRSIKNINARIKDLDVENKQLKQAKEQLERKIKIINNKRSKTTRNE